MSDQDIIIADLRRKIDCGTHDEDGCGSCSRCLACVKNAHDSLLDRVKFTLRQLGKAQAEAQCLRNQTENDTAKIYDLRRQLDRMREERSFELSEARQGIEELVSKLHAVRRERDEARAELARLRARMPSEEERVAIIACVDVACAALHRTNGHPHTALAFQWLARQVSQEDSDG